MTSAPDACRSERFSGRVALLTAAASGIGLAAARRFAREGATVHLCALHEESAARASETLRAEGGRAFGHRCDVADSSAVDDLVTRVIDDAGRIDVLVNNAGARLPGRAIHDVTDDLWHQEIAVTLDGTFFTIRAVIPSMVAQGSGAIVNVCSTAALGGAGGGHAMIAYGAAKAAVLNLTRILAIQHGQDGIRINAVLPATTASPHTLAWLETLEPSGGRSEWERQIPLGRIAEPNEVASVIAFLASTDASYVTGAMYAVDGGVSAQLGSPRLERHANGAPR